MPSSILPGSPFPLGATWNVHEDGTNFALFSQHGDGVDLCLFDPRTGRETARIPLPTYSHHVWHGFVPGIRPGQPYGYRVHGRYAPLEGLRFNHAKLLIDPYARAIDGRVAPTDSMFGYRVGGKHEDLVRDARNSSGSMPRSIVIDTKSFDWGGDRPPSVPWSDTVIYETHVKGLTIGHPDIPSHLRGTYSGLASEPVIDYLRNLGITAVELLPIHHFVDDKFLVDKNRVNYWGYSSIGYFAPESRYSSSGTSGGQVNEFKSMVKKLHSANLEVIIDVVYNHTGEGSHIGPTLSFRGIDNLSYYSLSVETKRLYSDVTGTGNTLNVAHAQTLKLIADSLRYWVEDMHVDGFRFDLASTLARDPVVGYDQGASFFDIIHQDPVLSRVKLIAEPWDLGHFGYQVGNFPILWSEWNGKYRDNVRRFWRGDESQIAELAYRLSGSSDLYRTGGRGPFASINFVTAHDGFTLRDLVSFNEKHNDGNGENNNDGTNDNYSWNCGTEGSSDDPEIEILRRRQQRNLIATLLLSQGVPMLCGGDELGRTQNGNNNVYCQDNEISWTNWTLDEERQSLLKFVKRLLAIRRSHPSLRHNAFLERVNHPGSELKDLTWFKIAGTEIKDAEWSDPGARSLGMRLAVRTERPLLLVLNAYHEDLPFTLPEAGPGRQWELLLATNQEDVACDRHAPGEVYLLAARSLALFEASDPS